MVLTYCYLILQRFVNSNTCSVLAQQLLLAGSTMLHNQNVPNNAITLSLPGMPAMPD